MAGIIDWGVSVIIAIITLLGYPGIVLLMTLESACLPVPSEVVMPFAGYIAFRDGTFDLIGLTIAGTIGNLIGAILAYWIGLKAGRAFVLRYGRFVLLREKHLVLAESWFAKYGEATTLFSRMLPIIRTFISLPAGMAKMDFKKFVLFTTIGSIPWNFALAYIGFQLGPRWEEIQAWFGAFDIVIIIAVIALVAFLLFLHFRGIKKEKVNEAKKSA
jgi:membrane protein DedA with SNARE-associated domain